MPVKVCNESREVVVVGKSKTLMSSVQPDLLRWTERCIIATGTDCVSKYFLNSVFVFKGSLMYGDRWPRKTRYLPS